MIMLNDEVFCIFGMLISAAAFILSVYLKTVKSRRISSGRYKPVEGRVVRVNNIVGIEKGNIVSNKGHNVDVEYVVDGRSYIVTDPGEISMGIFSVHSGFRCREPVRRVGEKVELLYDTKHPSVVRLPDSGKYKYSVMAICVVIFLFSLYGLLRIHQ